MGPIAVSSMLIERDFCEDESIRQRGKSFPVSVHLAERTRSISHIPECFLMLTM